MKRLSQSIGSQLGNVAGQVFFIAIFVAIFVYQWRQGYFLQAFGAALLIGFFVFGLVTIVRRHRKAAKGMLIAAGLLVAMNLLFTFSVPNISMAAHTGGLITGFLIAAAVGSPHRLRQAWALTDRCVPPAYFTYDTTTDKFCYHGPARFAVEARLTQLSELASNVDKHSWPQYIRLYEVDPATLIDCEVQDPAQLLHFAPALPRGERAPETSARTSAS